MSQPVSVELVPVVVETRLGALYSFPDMDKRVVHEMLNKSDIALHGDLALANMSGAVLVIPLRIIKTITVNGEVKWRGIGHGTPVHEL